MDIEHEIAKKLGLLATHGDGLVMTKNEDPPLRSPKRTPDLPSQGRTGLGGSVSWIAIIISP